MNTLKTKTAKSNHFVHPPGVASTEWYSLIKCVYEYTVVEWPHTSDE